MAARAGFKPTTLRSNDVASTNAPCPTHNVMRGVINNLCLQAVWAIVSLCSLHTMGLAVDIGLFVSSLVLKVFSSIKKCLRIGAGKDLHSAGPATSNIQNC